MQTNTSYKFGPFLLKPTDYSLLRDGERVHLERKALEVLIVLVKNHGHLVKKEQLIDEVWGVGYSMTTGNLNRRVGEIREALDKDDPANPRYVKTEPRLGYRFIAPVEQQESDSLETVAAPAPPQSEPVAARHEAGEAAKQQPLPAGGEDRQATWRPNRKLVVAGIISMLVLASIAFVWWRRTTETRIQRGSRMEVRSPSDEAEVMRVVKESQMYETLGIYTNPEAFDRQQLNKYWVSVEQGGKAVTSIEAAVARLRKNGWRYSPTESKMEIFDFRYVRVFSPRDYAEVGTSERWFVPTIQADGSRVENRNVYLGVWDIDYTLRKIDGRWLLEENSTPRPRANSNQNK